MGNIRYRELYERQYGEGKLPAVLPRPWFGLRKLLRPLDVSRYDLAFRWLRRGGRKVLDLGCGSGEMLLRLSGIFETLVGLDVSPSRLREADRRLRETGRQCYFVEANLDDPLPFPDGQFDAVVCLSTLEHVFDVFGVTREIARVLIPGGLAVIQVPNVAYLPNRLALLAGRLPITGSRLHWEEVGWDGGHIHWFTAATLRWLLERAGLQVEVERMAGSGFLAPLRWWWPSLLCGDVAALVRKPRSER